MEEILLGTEAMTLPALIAVARAGARVRIAAESEERIRRARDRVERERAEVGHQKTQTAISIGATVLGAFLGRRAIGSGSLGRAATAARGAGRVAREMGDVARAEENLSVLKTQLADLESEFEGEVQAVSALEASREELEPIRIRPRKADIEIETVGLAWAPEETRGAGRPHPLL